MLSGLGDTFGRATGNVYITIFAAIDGMESLAFWLFLYCSIGYFLFVVIAAVFYQRFTSRFRVRVAYNFNKTMRTSGGPPVEILRRVTDEDQYED